MDIQALHATLASTLVPFGDQFRQAESQLAVFEQKPQFVPSLLALLVEPAVDLNIKRAAAVHLKNKVTRHWHPHSHLGQANAISDADKQVFKQELINALVITPPVLTDFLLVCLASVLSYDFQHGQWPEVVSEICKLLDSSQHFASMSAGLQALKQLCKFYRWNTLEKNKQMAPLMDKIFPRVLSIAEAALQHIQSDLQEADDACYGLIYESLKIYKLAASRYLPPVFRDPTVAQRVVQLFCNVIMLPWPARVLAAEPSSERCSMLPVKCVKWATTNLLRTQNLYLTKSYAHLSENSAHYAPFREQSVQEFCPQVTDLLIKRLQNWSLDPQGNAWLSERILYTITSYLHAMIELTPVFQQHIEPHLSGLLGQVLYPLMAPTDEDFEEFQNDPNEFVQRRVSFNDMMLTPGYAASEFIRQLVKKRKHTLEIVVQFLQQCAEATQIADQKLGNESPSIADVKNRVALFNLVQALAPSFLKKGSVLYSQLEPFAALFVVSALSSPNAYLRYEACTTTTNLGSVKFTSRETVQQLFQGVLNCFFDGEYMPVQVAAAQTLEALSQQGHNEDISSALGSHITEVVRNLLSIMEKIDLEALLGVLDHFVDKYPDEITPFAVDLADQLTRQFLMLASEIVDVQRQSAEESGLDNRVVESELMMANDEKTCAGLGMLTSITNLQNKLEHQRDLAIKLDEIVSPVFLAVYQHKLTDFYPDCLSVHENTLFTIKSVPNHHWQSFDLLMRIVDETKLDYFEETMPVFENYIVYGAGGLAALPERLQQFVSLLIDLFGPPPPEKPVYDCGPSAAFSEATTRIQVMRITSNLLVSSDLFNGPLASYIGPLVETTLNRVAYDEQQGEAKRGGFPPRYNVAAVSIVLGALYHNPSVTLDVLHRTGSADSFFQTWMMTLPEFLRLNDLKLSLMAVLSLFSYQSGHIEFEPPYFTSLLEAFTHILEALPGAAARMVELMQREHSDDWDDDLDEFDNDDDDYEDNEDAGAEFDREVGSAVNDIGDGTFMYENPGHNTGSSSTTLNGEDDTINEEVARQVREAFAASAETGFITDDFEEDIYSTSPLDSLNVYDALRTVMFSIRDTQKLLYDRIIGGLSESGKAALDESLQRKALPKYEP